MHPDVSFRAPDLKPMKLALMVPLSPHTIRSRAVYRGLMPSSFPGLRNARSTRAQGRQYLTSSDLGHDADNVAVRIFEEDHPKIVIGHFGDEMGLVDEDDTTLFEGAICRVDVA